MDRYKETFETWNKVASLYRDRFMDLDLYNGTYDLVCGAVTKPGAAILDIGCGPGNISRYLLTKRPDFRIHGIDVAPNMVALARENNPAARFDVMDCREIDRLESRYDGIVCGFCLPYLSPSDCRKLFSDAYGLLHENGLLYLSFVEGDPERSGYVAGSTCDRSYFYYHDADTLQKELTGSGFGAPETYTAAYKKSAEETDYHTIWTTMKTTHENSRE